MESVCTVIALDAKRDGRILWVSKKLKTPRWYDYSSKEDKKKCVKYILTQPILYLFTPTN